MSLLKKLAVGVATAVAIYKKTRSTSEAKAPSESKAAHVAAESDAKPSNGPVKRRRSRKKRHARPQKSL